MKRRIAAVLLALCMCIGLLPATALAATAGGDNSPVTLEYENNGSAAEYTVNVSVYISQAEAPDATFTVTDANKTDNEMRIKVKENVDYEIDHVTFDGEGVQSYKETSSDLKSYSFHQTWGNIVSLAEPLEVKVYLRTPLPKPDTPEGVYEDDNLIDFRAYYPHLLKLLYLGLKDKSQVKVDTEITEVTVNFVEPFGYGEDTSFIRADREEDYLHYTFSNLSGLAVPNNVESLTIESTAGTVTVGAGDLRFVLGYEVGATDGGPYYSIEANNDDLCVVYFYNETTANNYVPYAVRFVEAGQSIGEENMPDPPEYGGNFEFVAWTEGYDGGKSFLSTTIVEEDLTVFSQRKDSLSASSEIHVMNNGGLLKERIAELYELNESAIDWDSVKISVYGKTDDNHTNPYYNISPNANGWRGTNGDEYYFVYNYPTGAGDQENDQVFINDITKIVITAQDSNGEDLGEVTINKGTYDGDFWVSTGAQGSGYITEIFINDNNSPEPDPDPAITDFTKTLVKTVQEATDAGVTEPTSYDYPDPANDNKVIIPYGKSVTLLYAITVTGKEGAAFTVTDTGADLVAGAEIAEDPADTFTGSIPDGGSITFYVSKTFTAEDLDTNKEGNQVLTNTANIDSDDGVGEDDKETEAETPAEEESYKVYTYVRFVNKDGTELTEDDKAEIEKLYGGTVNNDGYVAIGTFEIPMPDPAKEPYAPERDGSGKGGPNVIVEHPDLWEAVQKDLTEDNFEPISNEIKIDLDDIEDWIKLSTAHGAENFGVESEIACWHLDGQIQLYDSDITVVKTLTQIERTDDAGTTSIITDITSDTALEVGDKLTWTITVTNTGNAAATGLKLSDELTADDTEITTGYTINAPSGIDKDNFSVAAKGEEGDEVTFTATYTVTDDDKGKTLTNTATVSDGEVPGGEDETENPVADRQVEIEKELTSAKRGENTTIGEGLKDYKARVGDVLSYTITVTNEGNTELTDVKVTDSLWKEGTNLTIKVGTTETPAIADANGSYTLAKGDVIEPKGIVTITYTYTVTEADALKESISNSVDVYLDSTEPGGGEDPDGEDDVTVKMDDYTIDIAPADIVIYTGGTGYAGVLENADGTLLTQPTESGLPQPGYHIELPEAVNAWLTAQGVDTSKVMDLAKLLHFAYDQDTQQREWGLTYMGVYDATAEGEITQYVYSLNPAMVDDKEVPVSILFTDKDGTPVTSDDITMSATAASDKFTIAINPGKLDQDDIQAVFTVEDEDGTEKTITCNVEVGTGTLTVKSTTDEEYVNEIGTVDNNQISATGEGVTYYVNNSEVEVASNRVGLLVDSVSNSDEFDANLKNHAIGEAQEENTSLASDARAQSFYLDLVDTKNGNAVVTPSGDVTIYWPMPADANPNGDFYIVHYDEMNRETVTAGPQSDPEILTVTKVGNHLTFTTGSFSPFVLVYEAKDTGGTDPGTNPDPDPNPGDDDPDEARLHFNSRGGTEFKDEVRDDPFRYNPYDKIPSRPGYRFTGWYNNSSLDKRYDEDEKIHVPLGSKTVFAGWEETTVPSMLNGDDHYAYIQGYADGSVRPNANITRAQVATIFFRLLDEDVRDDYLTTYNTFPDVDQDYWANTAISTMASLGVINGRNSGLFDPDAYITRAEFAAICARFDDSGVDGITTFTDTVGHWAEDEISRAAALGWIQGYADGTFRPNQYITRAQAVTMINRVLCRLPETEDDLLTGMNTWTDCHVTDWFYLAIQEATNSHDFVAKDRVYESWTDLNRAPDWSRYE